MNAAPSPDEFSRALDALPHETIEALYRSTAVPRQAVRHPLRSIASVISAAGSFLLGLSWVVDAYYGVALLPLFILCSLVGGLAGAALTLILACRR